MRFRHEVVAQKIAFDGGTGDGSTGVHGEGGASRGPVKGEAGGRWKWVLSGPECLRMAPQECRRRGALEPLGRAELGGKRLAQTCRSLAGNDRRGPAGPSPLIFPAGPVWESIPDPKSQGGLRRSAPLSL